jgi:hypothetical protein
MKPRSTGVHFRIPGPRASGPSKTVSTDRPAVNSLFSWKDRKMGFAKYALPLGRKEGV